MGISETWLLSTTPSSFISVPGYYVHRHDVVGDRPKHGVCLYIKSTLKYVIINIHIPNIIVVHLPDFELYIINVYRPPSNTQAQNTQIIQFLNDFVVNKEVILMEDFNLSNINWHSNPKTHLGAPSFETYFLHCFTSLGLTQTVLSPTFFSSGNILDLFLLTDPDRNLETIILPPLPRCGHSPILLKY